MTVSIRAASAAAVAAGAAFGFGSPTRAQEVPVLLTQSKSGAFTLTRGGKPYFIKGAGGQNSLPLLKESGGNSIRTWGSDNIGPLLDEAQKLGLTVCVGVWFGHKEHGFSYLDAKAVAEQQGRVKETVMKYRNHPAVIAWAMGNEMENGLPQDQTLPMWKAVQDGAALCKSLDKKHPVLTVVAEIGGDKVKQINTLCPDVDIIGINSYGGAASLPERYKAAGGVKPYVITEFGPAGTWESPKTPWGATPELTSTQKAAAYKTVYEKAVQNQPLCLGSYAFVWGSKQEATATWFGMLLPSGEKLAPVDALTELWSGKKPQNLCPVIETLKLDGTDQPDAGSIIKASLAVSDPNGDPLNVRWVLQKDDLPKPSGGDTEPKPPTFPGAITDASKTGATVQMPKIPGAYRLFAYVDDGKGGAAVGNIALFAKGSDTSAKTPDAKPAAIVPTTADKKSGEAALAPIRKAALPLLLISEPASRDKTYASTGWMGNTGAIKMDEACKEAPHSGATCLKVTYDAPDNWAGVVWQSPADDWGDLPGGLDLSQAKKLTFWARGETGGETVTFEFGILGKDKKYGDSGTAKKDLVKLTKDWKPYTIDLSGVDMSRIKTGFGWIVGGQQKPVTFYLDDVKYE